MIIFNKIIDNDTSILDVFKNSCTEVGDVINTFADSQGLLDIEFNNKEKNESITYEALLEAALSYCKQNLPSPMNMRYPDCVSITVGINFFTLKINPNFGFGVKILTSRDGTVRYELSLVFEKDLVFAKNMPFYNDIINHEWYCKEIKSHIKTNRFYKKKED